MTRNWLLVASLTGLLARVAECGPGEQGSPARRNFRASSDARFTEAEACQQARERLESALLAHLAARTAGGVPERFLRRALPRLLNSPDARCD